MSRWIILSVLVVALTAAATVVLQTMPASTSKATGVAFPAASSAEKKGPLPKAAVVEGGDLTYRFETKAQRTKFDWEWVIKNVGKAPLTLSLEAPPCSCTVANFQGKDGKTTVSEISVAPGDQIPIHFTWDTRTYDGKYEKPATLLTNDPEHPKFVFAAVGEVRPAIRIFPDPTVTFVEISTDEETHQSPVAVFSYDRPDFKLTSVKSSKPGVVVADWQPLSAEECTNLKAKAGYKVMVSVNRGMALGTFREQLTLATDHPKQPEFSLTVEGKVVGPITVVPERLRWLDIVSSTGGKKEITLLVRGQREVKFEVAHAPKDLKVEVLPSDSLPKVRKYKLTITLPPGAPAGAIDDEIVLKTDHPQASEVRVPTNLLIRDAS